MHGWFNWSKRSRQTQILFITFVVSILIGILIWQQRERLVMDWHGMAWHRIVQYSISNRNRKLKAYRQKPNRSFNARFTWQQRQYLHHGDPSTKSLETKQQPKKTTTRAREKKRDHNSIWFIQNRKKPTNVWILTVSLVNSGKWCKWLELYFVVSMCFGFYMFFFFLLYCTICMGLIVRLAGFCVS